MNDTVRCHALWRRVDDVAMPYAIQIAAGRMTESYAGSDAAPRLESLHAGVNPGREIEAIDWIRVSPAIRTPGKRD